MEPNLPKGSLTLTLPINTDNIEVGDIIVFTLDSSPDTTISHRVVEVITGSTPSFYTQGDANYQKDLWIVKSANVKGKIYFHVPFVGSVVNSISDYVRSMVGLITLVCIPTLIIIISTIVGIKPRNTLRERRFKLLKKRNRQWRGLSR
jgi:signal peptidase